MTAKRLYVAIGLLLLVVLALAIGIPQYQRAKVGAFCESVAGLSQHDLGEFASRCGRFWSEKGGRSAIENTITDANSLSRFKLSGRFPHIVNLSSNAVVLHYLDFKHDCALVEWGEGFSESGDDRVWNLRTVHDDTAWRVLYTAGQGDGEPSGLSQ